MAQKLRMGTFVWAIDSQMQISLAKIVSDRASWGYEQNPYEILQEQEQLQSTHLKHDIQFLPDVEWVRAE